MTEKIVIYRKGVNTVQNLPLAMMLVPISSIVTFGLLMYIGSSQTMKHHLNELKLLAVKQKTSDILEYVEDMQTFMKNPDEIVSSGNKEIDSLLNYMLQKAKKSLRSASVKIQIPEEISHIFDINIIQGYLMKITIEAAEKKEDCGKYHGIIEIYPDGKRFCIKVILYLPETDF